MIFVTVSTGHFDALLEACVALSRRYPLQAQIGCSRFAPPFPHFRTAPPDVLAGHIRSARLVIAHAGTGTLATLYRARKPSVVVPKQSRYGEANDGQVELAKKWGELGMALVCLDLSELESTVERALETKFVFPARPFLGESLALDFSER